MKKTSGRVTAAKGRATSASKGRRKVTRRKSVAFAPSNEWYAAGRIAINAIAVNNARYKWLRRQFADPIAIDRWCDEGLKIEMRRGDMV